MQSRLSHTWQEFIGVAGHGARVFSGPVVEYPQVCLHDLIQAQAEQTPSRIAVRFENEALNYGELAGRANQLAAYLRSRGVGPGKLVAICVERSLEMMVGLLGILKTGAAYVPLDPAYPLERRRTILEVGQVCALVSQQSLAAATAAYQGEVVYLDSDWRNISRFSSSPCESGVAPEDRAYVIFTSGSTGRPKGVQISHRAVVNLLNSMRRELDVRSEDMFAALASFAFDMCIPELYLPLICGACVLIARRELAADGEQLLEFIQRRHATIMQATPTTWMLLLNAGFSNPGMRMICGAEPLPAKICAQILQRTSRLYNFYGPTETTVWSTFDVLEPPGPQVTIGRPLDNTRVYVLNQALEPVALGETGELFIGGDGLAIGYLGDPRLSAERFIPDFFSPIPGSRIYRTRDFGRQLEDGRIEFAGRADRQVKIRGFRIELGEIEESLLSCPSVSEAVAAVYEADGNKRIVAYLTGEDIEVEKLRAKLERRLPEYMIPAAFVTLPTLPRLPNGKVNHTSLPAPGFDAFCSRQHVGPRNATEEFLVKVWQEVLRISCVGIFDDFFRLGAHSLLVIQAASRVRNKFRIELPIKTMFETRTIARLASEIDRLRLNAQDRNLIPPADGSLLGFLSQESLNDALEKLSEPEIDALLAELCNERVAE